MKRFIALFIAMLGVVAPSAWAQTETIDFSQLGFENSQAVTSVNGTNCSIDFVRGTNTHGAIPRYYNIGTAVRIYGGNEMTVTALDNHIISQIEFTFSSGGNNNAITVNTGSYASGMWTGNASAVVFHVDGNSGHRRLRQLTITYVSSLTPPVISGTTPFEGSTTVTISSAEGATVYYTTKGGTPTSDSTRYTGPFTLTRTTVVKAIAMMGGIYSNVSTKVFENSAGVWGGTGTRTDPYLIRDVDGMEQLATRVSSGESYRGIYFKLANDIVYNYSDAWNLVGSTENNFTPIGSAGAADLPFNGHFDGDGHTISGIRYCNPSQNHHVGLFGKLDRGALVSNVTLDDARITAGDRTGGIAGLNLGMIENCHVSPRVCIHDPGSGNDHGGLVGYNQGGQILHCTSSATLSIENGYNGGKYGGLVGYNQGTITNCLVIGATLPDGSRFTLSPKRLGAVVGDNDNNIIGCLYNACTFGSVEATTGIGYSSGSTEAALAHTVTPATEGLTLRFDNDAPNPDLVEVYSFGLAYGGVLYAASGASVTFRPCPPAGYAASSVAASSGTLTDNNDGTYTLAMPNTDVAVTATLVPSQGSGTADDPYNIWSITDMDRLASEVNAGNTHEGHYYQLVVDLDYTGQSYTPVGQSVQSPYENKIFQGSFDGLGHTVRGVNINTTAEVQGLFAKIGGQSYVQNLTLAASTIAGGGGTGGIVGWNSGFVVNCHVEDDVTIVANTNDVMFGGIVGLNQQTIRGCTSAASIVKGEGVTSMENCGGIAGYSPGGSIDKCLYLGTTVEGTNAQTVGAVVGQCAGFTNSADYHTSPTLVACHIPNNAESDGAQRGYGHSAMPDVLLPNVDHYPYDGITAYTAPDNSSEYVLLYKGVYYYRTAPTAVFATSGAWNDPSNWNTGTVPSDGVDVLIEADAVIPNGCIAVPGVVTLGNGSLTLADGGQWMAPNSVRIAVQKAVPSTVWQAMATPVYNPAVVSVTHLASGAYDLFRYDEPSGTWENQKASEGAAIGFSVMESGRGYIYRRGAACTLFFSGSTVVGDVPLTLTATPTAGDLEGFNLVGNPYTHQIHIDVPYYGLGTDGTWIAHSDGGTLSVGQAVLVYTAEGETLTLTESGIAGSKQTALPPLPKGLMLDGSHSDNQALTQSSNPDFAHWDGRTLVIEGTGTLQAFDLMGRQLFTYEIDSKFSIPNSQFPTTGVYLLRLVGTDLKTQKIVVKH